MCLFIATLSFPPFLGPWMLNQASSLDNPFQRCRPIAGKSAIYSTQLGQGLKRRPQQQRQAGDEVDSDLKKKKK
jgi:hypothetical protein